MTAPARALITGASAGIGRSFAEQLARAGYSLVLVARRKDRLEELAATLRDAHGIEVEVLPADLGSPEGVAIVAARLAAEPPVDMLVNNAGYASRGKVAELDTAALDAMLRVNIGALSHLSVAALKQMSARGVGTIINIGSGTMFAQLPANAGYGASKSFVASFTRTMQVEAADSGVRIQLLVPGLIATEFHEVAGADASRFPPHMVMQADDLVAASLRALALGEPVCIPSMPDIADWEAYATASQKMLTQVSRNQAAARYTA